MRARIFGSLLAGILLAVTSCSSTPAVFITDGLVLSVDGNRLVDQAGTTVQLRGVNRSGTEYACAQGWGIHDTRSFADADEIMEGIIDSMVDWGVNSVRVPLNEHCWLGRNGVNKTFGGAAYREEITDFVSRLRERGLVVVLALMWASPGDQLALRQPHMANQDHSIDFWRSVGETFRDDGGLLFELFGEPSIGDDWDCWLNGCEFDGFLVAGLQSLVDAVRSGGATQPLIISGLAYANDLTGWLDHRPSDPLEQIIAGLHLYNFNLCNDVTCWDESIDPVAAVVPVVTAELGEDLCDGAFIETYMDWADARSISYLAWAFNSQDSCSRGPALLENPEGVPTPYGAVYRDRLLELAPSE